MRIGKSLSLFADIKEIPAVLDQKHYPSLNGIRGLAVMLVVFSHIILYQGNSYAMLFIGSLGVNIFFVLSGFLITTLCIKEKVLTDDLCLKNFYIRRALRILPVAYLYILVIMILNFANVIKVSNISLITSALFVADFSYFRKTHFDWTLGHYWSLSVEEQFYLIFPVFIKKRFDLFVLLVMAILFLLPVMLWLQSINVLPNTGLLYFLTHFLIKFQAISLGCFFSILCFKGYLNFGKLRPYISILSLAVIFSIKYDDFFSLKAVLANLFISALTGLLIINSIYRSNDILFKFFNFKPIAIIGILSYSIYIWQELFLSDAPNFPPNIYPYSLIFVVVVPYLSYYYFEKFFLKFKTRFTTNMVKIKS